MWFADKTNREKKQVYSLDFLKRFMLKELAKDEFVAKQINVIEDQELDQDDSSESEVSSQGAQSTGSKLPKIEELAQYEKSSSSSDAGKRTAKNLAILQPKVSLPKKSTVVKGSSFKDQPVKALPLDMKRKTSEQPVLAKTISDQPALPKKISDQPAVERKKSTVSSIEKKSYQSFYENTIKQRPLWPEGDDSSECSLAF